MDRKKEEMKGGPYWTKQLEIQPRNENVGDVSGGARSKTDSLKQGFGNMRLERENRVKLSMPT